jgi:hypothetical protein
MLFRLSRESPPYQGRVLIEVYQLYNHIEVPAQTGGNRTIGSKTELGIESSFMP